MGVTDALFHKQVMGTAADPIAQLRAMRRWCAAIPTARDWEVVTMPYIAFPDTLPRAEQQTDDNTITILLIVGVVVMGIIMVLVCTGIVWLCIRTRPETGGYAAVPHYSRNA